LTGNKYDLSGRVTDLNPVSARRNTPHFPVQIPGQSLRINRAAGRRLLGIQNRTDFGSFIVQFGIKRMQQTAAGGQV
jgi:hypothetical protein